MDKHMKMIPGTPTPGDVQSDSIELFWESPAYRGPGGRKYKIQYKEGPNEVWKTYKEKPERACVIMTGLKSECSYKFRVRSVCKDDKSPYSPESPEIITKASLASTLLPSTTKEKEGKNGTPSIHRVKSIENRNARNNTDKTRKLEIEETFHRCPNQAADDHIDILDWKSTEGKPPLTGAFEKTILLVGETGSGKSTLVDVFINYIFGVNYQDPYRFRLVNLESDEMSKSQAFSQTQWVTCYTVHPGPGSRIPYTLNIIDTPGFGDTGGLNRDKIVYEQLTWLFSSNGEKGLVFIDAVCICIKAQDARLTSHIKHTFTSVCSLFGKNIENNMCALITFADSEKPQVLSAMEEAKVPVKDWHKFNNSCLFAENDSSSTSLARMFWEMGNKSLHKFFECLKKMKTKSLQQTKEVLENRKRMEVKISNLEPLLDVRLKRQEEVSKEMMTIEKHERDIAQNKDFTYKVTETHLQKSELPEGNFATNCLKCKSTCHRDCSGSMNWTKYSNYLCSAMKLNGSCSVCEGKCSFRQHTNEPFVYIAVQKEVTKICTAQLEKYETAKEMKSKYEIVIEKKKKDLHDAETSILSMMEDIRQSKNLLIETALQPNVISMKELIDQLIQTARMGNREGFQERIAILEGLQERFKNDRYLRK